MSTIAVSIQSFLTRQTLQNAGSGASLFAAADGAAQYLEQRDRPQRRTDVWRLIGAATMGTFFTGLVYPWAYHMLDKRFPGKSWRAIITKSAIEIVTVGVFVNSTSMLLRGYWQGTHEPCNVQRHVLFEIPAVTYTDAKVWTPYNVIAFGYIPASVRPLTTSAMEAGWQTYISLRSHDYTPQEKTS